MPMITHLTDEFIESLTSEIFRAQDFFDWNKINDRLNELETNITILQKLLKKDLKHELVNSLLKYPDLLRLIHMLTAHQPRRLSIEDGFALDFEEEYRQPIGDRRAFEIVSVMNRMGLLDLLEETDSLKDLVRGILIGLEPNSRKARRGDIFEKLVKRLLEEVVGKVATDLKTKLYLRQQYVIQLVEEKTVNFAILLHDKPVIVVEANYYATSGSKPTETLTRAYPELQDALKGKNITFIVITDGDGWRKMRKQIPTMLHKLDHCFTYRQAKDGRLEQCVRNVVREQVYK